MSNLNKILLLIIGILSVSLIILSILFYNIKSEVDLMYVMYQGSQDANNDLKKQLENYKEFDGVGVNNEI